MFFHTKHLQYHAKPERPDPLYARKLQEVLGGQWGEISVMMTYLFQGWNCRGPAKYRDMIMDIGTEEIGHVEMLATMIASGRMPIRPLPASEPRSSMFTRSVSAHGSSPPTGPTAPSGRSWWGSADHAGDDGTVSRCTLNTRRGLPRTASIDTAPSP